MTENTDNNDKDLKPYLEGGDGVSAAYGKIEQPDVPSYLDRRILDAAREDSALKNVTGKSGSYFSQKYSIAASLVVCVLIGAIYLSDEDIFRQEAEPASSVSQNQDRLKQDDFSTSLAERVDENTAARDVENSSNQQVESELQQFAGRQVAADSGAEAGSNDENISEVVVTGSRIRTDSMDSPNPVVVVTLDEIELTNPASVVDGLAELPQFRESYTAGSDNSTTRAGSSEPDDYRSNPESWARYIYSLSVELETLTQQGLIATTDTDLNDSPAEEIVTASSTSEPVASPEMTDGATASNNEFVADTEETDESSLRARLELERSDFSDTYPELSLDEMIEDIRNATENESN